MVSNYHSPRYAKSYATGPSTKLLEELESVLARNKFASKLKERNIAPSFLMKRYGMLATLVVPEMIERTVPHDIDDDVVIATALAGQADVIVTGDNHLLMLHPWKHIDILSPVDALQYVLSAK